MKILKALWLLVVYVLVLSAVYYLHMQYLNVDVVFYSSLMDALLATVPIVAYLFFSKKSAFFNNFEKLQMVVVCLLIGYILAISIPTVIDRSLSFYILEKIEQQNGGIKLDQFENVFTIDYMRDHRLADVRLTEQLRSGTIIIQERCVMLTSRGRMLVAFSKFYREHLLPKHRLLMDRYTDELTHSFIINENATRYQCK